MLNKIPTTQILFITKKRAPGRILANSYRRLTVEVRTNIGKKWKEEKILSEDPFKNISF